jgi:hypothetical protein
MAKKELARDRQPGERIQKVIDQLRGGVPPVDPVQASWDDPEGGASFGYYNFHEHRHEYGRGKIPHDQLWKYLPTP